ncbi:MAG: hypothetical protein Ta2E_10510 [Mycoplasmoidaceae bacterium]|nr:MAG: hypothetical protein Ta2E_10510 [Mycoplasmoidaceae bacterium]
MKRLRLSEEEYKLELDQLAKTGLPPEGFVVTSDINTAIIRRRLTKKEEKKKAEEGIIIKVAEVLIKKN